MLKKDVDKAVNFMNEKIKDFNNENKELKNKICSLLSENKQLHDQLEKTEGDTTRSNLELNYIGRNLKSKNVEISRESLKKYENTMELAVKVIKKQIHS